MQQEFSLPAVLPRYREYLQSYYTNVLTMRDDKLAIAPCTNFIYLALIENSSSATMGCALTGYMNQFSKNHIELDTILTGKAKFILVEGPAGMGKSTLCWELCRKWNTLESLKDYELVLLLKLRDRRIQNATMLNEIFYHSNKKLSQSVSEEVEKCEGEGVLLILDGFDEMPTSVLQESRRLIMEIISGTCLPAATRLVTSRPSALHRKIKCFPGVDRHFEILGFTDESKIIYAESVFRMEPEVLRHFKNFVFSNPIINSLMYVPVNCAIIAQVYRDIRKSRKPMPKTMTELYTTLVLVLIRRCMIERGEWDEYLKVPTAFENLPEDVTTALKAVSKLAYTGLFRREIQLDFSDSDVGDNFNHLGLLSETKEMYVTEGVRTSYSFLHLSIQEFLAAWHISQLPNLTYQGVFSSITDRARCNTIDFYLEAFSKFLAGLIGCDKFPEGRLTLQFGKIYTDTFHYLHSSNVLRYLYEAHDPSNFGVFFNDQPYYSTFLRTPLDVHIFGYCLIHAPVEWQVEVSTSLEGLTSSLACHMPSNEKIAGFVRRLHAYVYCEKPKFHIEKLPRHVRHTISIMHVTVFVSTCSLASLSAGILSLHNLEEFYLDIRTKFEDDYLLFRALGRLSILHLKFELNSLTAKGIEELSTVIAGSCSLKSINIKCCGSYNVSAQDEEREVHQLVEAALSCCTVTQLSVTIPSMKHFICGSHDF